MAEPLGNSVALGLTRKGSELGRTAGVSFASSLRFENVEHRYGDVPVIRDLDLEVRTSEILCLLGPSGSGKTTLLRVAAGLEPVRSGRVLLNDRPISGETNLPPERRGIAYMFQDFALFPHLTVVENVMFGLSSLPRNDRRRAANAALERVDLADFSDRLPDQLSGGQQQRVALARALAPRPGVVLMDEPFSGLDARLKDSVRADTLRILRETRATALIVTHDADEAMRLGDRVALLRDGRLVQSGTTRELFRAPVDLFTAGFFSDLNLFDGIAGSGDVETRLGRLPYDGPLMGRVTVAIRPGGFDYDPNSTIITNVVARRYLGEDETFWLSLDGRAEPLRVRLRENEVPEGAKRVGLSPHVDDVLVFESQNANA